MRITAGIILSTAFVLPKKLAYVNYINYMNRSEAVRNESFNKYNLFSERNINVAKNTIEEANESMFKNYSDYMANPQKTSALFTNTYDRLPDSEIDKMKKYFEVAQENGSPLWQHVFSFKNEWLVNHGFMNEISEKVNESALYAAARLAMKELEKKENLNGKWIGAIHYNTDNIHVHIGYVESVSTRKLITAGQGKNVFERKGKFLKKNIKSTRSVFVNELLNMNELLQVTSEQFNKIVQQSKENKEFFGAKNYGDLFKELYESMPENRSHWNYGYAEKQNFKKQVDKITTLYLNSEQSDELKSLIAKLLPLSNEYESAYGNPKNQPTYLENKLYAKNGLYHKLGNTILERLRIYDKEIAKPQIKSKLENSKLERTYKLIKDRSIEEEQDLFLSSLYVNEPKEQIVDELDENINDLFQSNPKIDEALRKIYASYEQNATRYKQRTERIIEEMNQKRQTDLFNEKNDKRDPNNLENETNPNSQTINKNKLNSNSSEINNNLARFSKENQRKILEANPDATLVFGSRQWRFCGRTVKKDQFDKPINLIGAVQENDQLYFFEFEGFDISQTEPYLPKIDSNILQNYVSTGRGISYKKNKYDAQQNQLENLVRSDYYHLKKMLRTTTQDYLNREIHYHVQFEMNELID
ncbi:MobP2 family relaxase [Enterococcus phoeniculicola]|uniref:Uncharacterized protein n=1 Tax=Enterococcus phoeniculicola ATCC BAA-412 TaxID=1158610 RepID=R3WMF0_9ENTE|nr:MobP2 family relaxase [Enterococcus phoeniculicola]EOL43000.1 hypothetical protein UC3_01977 [Enterococcus phoeniculicola ATCC BAA-412]EOT76642.1 hypothetical protein I589_01599 [Enterococcus phoeniculicola ATCC BAA-412]